MNKLVYSSLYSQLERTAETDSDYNYVASLLSANLLYTQQHNKHVDQTVSDKIKRLINTQVTCMWD
jgi:hypothetical protein